MRIYRCFLYTALLGIALLASSCGSTKKIVYFQDLKPGESSIQTATPMDIRMKPGDKISIIVNSRDPQLASLFNLMNISRQLSSARTSGRNATNSSNQNIIGYTIDNEGYIDFPVLGKVHIAGMTREEITVYLKNELISKNLVKDPIVTVEYMNLYVSVLGEVNSPGQFSIDRDQITILDAISMAGDLTINGRRENIMVLRQEDNRQQVYNINLTSGEQIYTSPAYYLQQNDVVYVEPNSMKARQSTVNGNNIRSTSFWFSLASFLLSIGILIFN